MGKDQLRAALEKKGPGALRQEGTVAARQIINPVDILATAASPIPSEQVSEKPLAKSDEQLKKRTVKANGKSDEKSKEQKQSGKSESINGTANSIRKINRRKRGDKPHIRSERDIHALLAVEKRDTERYSFEIYTDQKEDIQHVCNLYEASTGKKLSASRFIREVLDYVLPGALEAFDKSDE